MGITIYQHQTHTGPGGTVFHRLGSDVIVSVLLFPFVAKDYKQQNRSWKDILLFLPLAALGAFPSQVLMTAGTRYSLASNAAIMVLILPVLTALLAFLLLKEK